jgi:Uma2 family endonuclease
MTLGASPSSKLGYADYCDFPNDGRRHEIIDGEHYVNPAPSMYHQTISKRLHYQLYSKIELGKLGLVFYAPIDVQLGDHDIVQPDLVAVVNSRKSIVAPSRIVGAPDLIVEILSQTSTRNDRTLKRELYERAGVAEYWIVDPVARIVEQLVLRAGDYAREPAGSELKLSILDGVAIELNEVW